MRETQRPFLIVRCTVIQCVRGSPRCDSFETESTDPVAPNRMHDVVGVVGVRGEWCGVCGGVCGVCGSGGGGSDGVYDEDVCP